MKKNYHTHTARCHHANGSEREYIEKALEAKLEILGFSDHTPYDFSDGHVSSFRMLSEELTGYVSTLQKLREEYKGRIDIPIGLEAEYYPDDWERYLALIDHSGVEYLILGQHFARAEHPGALYSGRANADKERLEDYITSVITAANTGLFSYFAHPDLICFTGDRDYFAKRLDYMIKEIQKTGIPFEINLLGLREGRHYPSELFFELLEKNKATVILGSDAHEPQWVYHEETIERALALVKKYNLTLTEEIDIGRLKRHGLL